MDSKPSPDLEPNNKRIIVNIDSKGNTKQKKEPTTPVKKPFVKKTMKKLIKNNSKGMKKHLQNKLNEAIISNNIESNEPNKQDKDQVKQSSYSSTKINEAITYFKDKSEEELQKSKLPEETLIEPDVPYGCLKRGNKPTYREYLKTMKNPRNHNNITISNAPLLQPIMKPVENINNISNNIVPPTPNVTPTEQSSMQGFIPIINTNVPPTLPLPLPTTTIKPPQLSDTMPLTLKENEVMVGGVNNTIKTRSHTIRRKPRKYIKKTIKTYSIGKNKKKNNVSIITTNNDYTDKVKKAVNIMRNKNISEIKKYLIDHNLIAYNSQAPSEMLRELYENAMLSGEIYNSNDSTKLDNFKENN